MENYQIYVGGHFVSSGTKLDVVNPYSNQTFAQTYLAGKDELEIAIDSAQKVQQQMKFLPSYKKYEILMQIANEIKQDRQRLAEILSMESGKPIKPALTEIDRAIQTFIVAAEESKRLPGEVISMDWTPAGTNKEGIVKYYPVGLVAGISPFNFPLNLAVHKIAPAIASGCPIILKPARSTPLSTLELAKIVDSTELPKGALSVLPMDRDAGNQLVTDERFNLLTFTGSPEVGWKMKRDAGKKRVVLELGGNAGVIVTQTADLEMAVKKCLIGGFSYAGQVCIHVQRIFVHQSVFEKFTSKIVDAAKRLINGDPLNAETDISVMIDEENALRVEAWINEAVANGAKILCGGKRFGCFVEPTFITQTNNSMKVCSQEIFGPVVTIEKYNDFDEAIRLINDSAYGLQAGVFTNDLKEMNAAFSHLEVGGVMINEVSAYRLDHMPYGGVKNSGFGREGIKYAILDMMETKLLVKDM